MNLQKKICLLGILFLLGCGENSVIAQTSSQDNVSVSSEQKAPVENQNKKDDSVEPVVYDTPQDLLEAALKVKIDFQENVHYEVIPGAELSKKKEMREYFSFFCGHCHAFWKTVSKMSLALPEDVYFVGNPVQFLGGPMGPELQKSYAAAFTMQMTEQFTDYFDNKIFVENKIPQNHEDVLNFVEDMGIPRDTFEKQYNSFPVQNIVSQYMQKTADSKIRGVPSVVINNKYRIETKNLNNEAEYLALVLYLANKDADFYK